MHKSITYNSKTTLSSKTSDNGILSVTGLVKSYGLNTVLHALDIEVQRGERVALMGRSGSGKSTLLNCICGIETFDKGTVTVADRSLSKLSQQQLEQMRREEIGYVFQGFHLLPTLNALENVEFPAQLTGMSRERRHSRARDLLALVGMEHREKHLPNALSGGERQRVALARSVMNSPLLILADEPTGSLDSSSGARVLDLLEKMSDESGAAILLVTHDPDNTRICSRTVHMQDGQIRETAQ